MQATMVLIAILLLSGMIMFPIGFNTAYVTYPLPAYQHWRSNQAVVEQAIFGAASKTASTPAVGAGQCAVKLWFVIYHSATGTLQRPKRIATWTTVALPPPVTTTTCSQLQTKQVYIYYDSTNPETVLSARKFGEEKSRYEDMHSSYSHIFWIGVTFISIALIPMVLWLGAMVFLQLLHSNGMAGMGAKPPPL